MLHQTDQDELSHVIHVTKHPIPNEDSGNLVIRV